MTLSPAATSAPARQKGVAEGKEFIALVTGLMAMSALGIDLMLPAFPDMRTTFGMAADSTDVAWIVNAYFLGMAAGPWLYGPASDRYGRRPPLVAGLVIYATAAALAALAPSWPLVVLSRFLWGVGAAGPRSLSVAMIRDRYEGDSMARLMSLIMAVFLLVPIAAPLVGAGLVHALPWRAVFWFPGVVALLLLLWSRRLPETLPEDRRRPFTWQSVRAASREVVTHRQTITLILAMTLLFGVLSAYLSGSEVIVEDVYDAREWFPVFFSAIAVVLALSSLNNARLVRHYGVHRLVRWLAMSGVAAGSALVVVSVLGGGRPNLVLWTVVLGVTLAIGQGLSPNSNTIAMAPVPHVAGTASSIIATVNSAGGALLGYLATTFFNGTVTPFSVTILAYLCVAAALILWGTARPEQ
ncbi:MAG: multidrug effflux MFS transporter [Acidimicrobiaceae bacterium]|nr:multidrug effflux MFS transporter [Acidimicrobiaceae bacterium]MCO5329238.1 multidrug effflux MFS transporter [Ilumatobacteraceae bacterium]